MRRKLVRSDARTWSQHSLPPSKSGCSGRQCSMSGVLVGRICEAPQGRKNDHVERQSIVPVAVKQGLRKAETRTAYIHSTSPSCFRSLAFDPASWCCTTPALFSPLPNCRLYLQTLFLISLHASLSSEPDARLHNASIADRD